MQKYKKIIYKSESNIGSVDLDSLLYNARAFNKSKNITGLLITFRDGFMQMIEGPESEINLLFSRILKDTRHYNIEVLYEVSTNINKVIFYNWSMGYLCLNKEGVKKLDNVDSYLEHFKNIAIHSLPLTES